MSWIRTFVCYCPDTACRFPKFNTKGEKIPRPAKCPSKPAQLTPQTPCVQLWASFGASPEEVLPQPYYKAKSENDWVKGTYLRPEQRSPIDEARLHGWEYCLI